MTSGQARIHQPGSLFNPGWFRIPSGPHKGEWHISGWMLSAIQTLDGWLSIAVCPICRSTIITEEDVHRFAYGDQQWAHERWHAKNDFPIPEEESKQ